MIMYAQPVERIVLPDVRGGKLPPKLTLLLALIIALLGLAAYVPH